MKKIKKIKSVANPQLEDGYTKIANEIMEALCSFRIPGATRQVIDCILRKTYGWNKTEDWISHSQIVKMTDMKKGNVSKWLSYAITHKLVIQSDNKLRFNKNYKEWISFSGKHFNPKPKGVKLSHTITRKKVIAEGSKVIAEGSKVIVTEGNKIHYTKDTITKDINKGIELFSKINPSYKLLFRNKTQRLSLKRLIDQHGWNWLESAIKRLPEINAMPYAPRVTTPYELEIKLGQIKAFLQQEKNKSTRRGVTKV